MPSKEAEGTFSEPRTVVDGLDAFFKSPSNARWGYIMMQRYYVNNTI
jgi:hypothetical protein